MSELTVDSRHAEQKYTERSPRQKGVDYLILPAQKRKILAARGLLMQLSRPGLLQADQHVLGRSASSAPLPCWVIYTSTSGLLQINGGGWARRACQRVPEVGVAGGEFAAHLSSLVYLPSLVHVLMIFVALCIRHTLGIALHRA